MGDDALAAVGATTSLYSLVIGFVIGMSDGFGVVLSRFFGAGEDGL
ncbi:MAG: MATE family efflux transporter [Lachnospiraceae bacterium]|nr:MATE family efflux transporter [Lachnospiraceae bacterium]